MLGYTLPAIDDDLMSKHLDSYTSNFWENVDTKIFFKNDISDRISKKLKQYKINYTEGVNEYWIPTVIDMLDEVETKYVEIYLEDIAVLDAEHLMYSFDVLNENNIDFMPFCYFNYWNKLCKWMSTYQDVQSTEMAKGGFTLMSWGTEQAKISRDYVFRNEIPGASGDPFPVSTGGIYKKSFLVETLERVLNSDYWRRVQEGGPNVFRDWAKNPYLPHSHEVWWKHNMDIVDLEYSILVPEYMHSKTVDPKNDHRFHLD